MISFLERYYKGLINTKKLEEYEYKLLECQYCSLIFQEQIPNEKFSQELYEEIIDQEDSLQKKENFQEVKIPIGKEVKFQIMLEREIVQKQESGLS